MSLQLELVKTSALTGFGSQRSPLSSSFQHIKKRKQIKTTQISDYLDLNYSYA